jgi:16S rRNA (adenine1518-N6/adenine1519-N6)-dimethyltransferase
MFQREVALRIASNPGNKNYGILSVLMQAYYDVKYLFTLEPADFTPAPKIHSGVISCRIKKEEYFPKSSDFELRNVVKAAFNQRRKKISNALLPIAPKTIINQLPYMDLRAEQLSWQMFDEIALKIEGAKRLSVY